MVILICSTFKAHTDKYWKVGSSFVAGVPSTRVLQVVCLLVGSLLAVGAAGQANDPGNVVTQKSDESVIEEVMVSARRRLENVQRVPMAVAAITPEVMKTDNIVKMNDIMRAAPAVSFVSYINSSLNDFYVRTLAAKSSAYFSEAPCCITLRGGGSANFLDMQSVEVLYGSQGTLFGRSSIGGAILFNPVRPVLNETEAFLGVSAGNYDSREFTGVLNLPVVSDMLAVRLAVSSENREGYTDQIGSNGKLDEVKNQQARLGIQFENGRFTNYTVVNYAEADRSDASSILRGINPNVPNLNMTPAAAQARFASLCTEAVSLGLAADVNTCVAQRVNILDDIKATLIEEWNRVEGGGDSEKRRQSASYNNQPALQTFRSIGIVNIAEFADILELRPVKFGVKHVASYEELRNNSGSAKDGVGGVLSIGTYNGNSRQRAGRNNSVGGNLVFDSGPSVKKVSSDIIVNLDFYNGVLNTSIGYFYSKFTVPESSFGAANLTKSFSGVFTPELGYRNSDRFNRRITGKEDAWYTQSTFDFSALEKNSIHGLSVTVGYRQTWNEDYSAGRSTTLDPTSLTLVPKPGLTERSSKFDGDNYLITVTEQFTPEFMVYVRYTETSNPGGINPIVVDPSSVPASYKPTYGEQTVTAWEVGSKLDFRLGNVAGRLNFAAYHYKYSDQISTFFALQPNGNRINYRVNAGVSEYDGFEVTAAIYPTESLAIRFGYSYNDAQRTKANSRDPLNVAQIGDAICGPASTPGVNCLLDLTDNAFYGSAKQQGHVTVTYQLPVAESMNLSANLYSQSRQYFTSFPQRVLEVLPDSLDAISQGSYVLLNLRGEWSDVFGSGFDTAIFVNNATDKLYATSMRQSLLSRGVAVGNYAPPRMFGIQFSKQF